LHEYSNRQWSGLLNDFYKPRWQQFFTLLQQSLRTGAEPDLKKFDETIRNWEWKWVKTEKAYPVVVAGNEVKVAIKMYEKYRKEVGGK
jgi:alpha-N-acetylglucosaminidase